MPASSPCIDDSTPTGEPANQPDEEREPSSDLASVVIALRTLVLLRGRSELRVSDVAADLGIARSTAHRVIAMLESHRFVERRTEGAGHVAGPALVDIGLVASSKSDILGVARPILDRLSADSTESAGFYSLVGRDAVLAAFVPGTRRLRVVAQIGQRQPAHLTPAGLAMLAVLSDAELARLYAGDDVEFGAKPRAWLREESALGLARERGFALDDRCRADGVTGVAAAVTNRRGDLFGAVSLLLPEARAGSDIGEAYGSLVMRAAHAIGDAIPTPGWRWD